MSILSIILIFMLGWYAYHFLKGMRGNTSFPEKVRRRFRKGRDIGLLGLITGILGQLIGFYSAFSVLETGVDVSPAMIYGGIKVSLITTLYGISIFLISMVIWFAGSVILEKKNQ